MRKHGIDAAASATVVSEPSTSTHPLQQVPAGVAASLRDPDLGPSDAATLIGAVTEPCVYCGRFNCALAFEHRRDWAACETSWRELAEGGAR